MYKNVIKSQSAKHHTPHSSLKIEASFTFQLLLSTRIWDLHEVDLRLLHSLNTYMWYTLRSISCGIQIFRKSFSQSRTH